ncbi:MAG: regulatory iron-sulfur-containing complex subunit RicT [Patescibacteria group bacterium]|nr:regulatory iron-sulfur-containing complex subunit RicT [Patescibacteria group bacterium]
MVFSAIKIRVHPWSDIIVVKSGGAKLKKGDVVIVKTDQGIENTSVLESFKTEEIVKEKEVSFIRKAQPDDLEKIKKYKNQAKEAVEYCKKMVDKHNLPMKLLNSFFSFDGGRLTFTFIADGRVDFRDLVKDLTRNFQKSIRLQQVGTRDEVKQEGGFGPCGRKLCCMTHLKKLGNISTDLARDQQIAHRGSDRLSGVCGKLFCCLAYEEDYYREMAKKFPSLESKIKTKQGRGKVISWNIIMKTYKVRLEDGTIIEMKLNKD